MNDQNTNTLNHAQGTGPGVPKPQTMPKFTPEVVKTILVNLFNKFYSNKKVFWPVAIFSGLVFLIIVLGLLFGKKRTTVIAPKITPQPFVLSTPHASPSAGILGTSGQKLIELRSQTDNLDVKQSRLRPPTLNFDIRF